MKKQIFKIGLLSLAFSLVFVACKDDDTTAPVITILGDNPDDLEMLQTYSDPGATAEDDEDGDVSSSITSTSEINSNLPGTYEIHYEASDAAGNFQDAHREVDVYATPAALAKSYTVKDSCGTGAALIVYNYSQTTTVASSSTIKFNKFADYSGNDDIVASVNSDGTITIALQQANDIGSATEDHTFQGSGHVTQTGFFIEYIDTNLSQGNASTTCRAYFTR